METKSCQTQMPVERIAELDLTPGDEGAISTLLEAAFAVPFGGRSFFKQRYTTRYVIRDDGDIVAHAGVGIRAVRMGARLVTISALSDVATASAHRGAGHATALMQALIADARTGNADFVVLFGDAPLYAALGFAPQANDIRFHAMDDGTSYDLRDETAPEGLMVLQTGSVSWDTSAQVDLLGTRF